MADLLAPVGLAEIAARHVANPNHLPELPPASYALAARLSAERAAKKSASTVLKDVANGRDATSAENGQKYDIRLRQQDVIRFGGDAGKLDQDGIAQPKDGITLPQSERMEEGRQAIENVTNVIVFMDILKYPPAERQHQLNLLIARDKSFAALHIITVQQLQTRAVNAMLSDEGVKAIVAAMPDAGTYDDAGRYYLVLDSMLSDPQFRDGVSANFHAIHEKLLQLPHATAEGGAKLQADKAQADRTLADKAADIANRLARAQQAGTLPNPGAIDVKVIMEGSASDKDFKRNLAIKMGVTDAAGVAQYIGNEQLLAQLNKQLLTGNFDDTTEITKTSATDTARVTTTTEKPTIKKGSQRTALEKQIEDLKLTQDTLSGQASQAFTDQLTIYKNVMAFTEEGDVRTDITDGVRASVEAARLATQIAAPGSAEISTSLNTRLDQEAAIIAEIKAVLGESLGAAWADQMDKDNVARDELMKKMIEQAGTDAEKALLRSMATRYVEYDAAKREKTIHGDEIMLGAKLLALGERGLLLAMGRDMQILDATLIENIFKPGAGNTAEAQQIMIDGLLDSLKLNDPAKFEALQKAAKDHGADYRQKVYGSYLVMDDYMKEGILGKAIRIGRKVKYDGSPRKLMERLTGNGNTILNVEELKSLFEYCKPDIDAAVKGNREAKNFIKKMQESGMVGNPDLLKKLAWLLFVILGIGSGLGAAAVLPGGLTAISGAVGVGAGGGIGSAIGGKAAEVAVGP